MSGIDPQIPVEYYSTEGDDGADPEVPADLLELYEVLEWERAVAQADHRHA